MTRVKIIVEGPTEESFIEKVLAPALYDRDVYLTPILVGVPGHKGGNVNYARVKKDILLHLRQDLSACCSTMLDLYALGDGFPGVPPSSNQPGAKQASTRELAIYQDIIASAPEVRADLRFIPTCRSMNTKDYCLVTLTPSQEDCGSRLFRRIFTRFAMLLSRLKTLTTVRSPLLRNGCSPRILLIAK